MALSGNPRKTNEGNGSETYIQINSNIDINYVSVLQNFKKKFVECLNATACTLSK